MELEIIDKEATAVIVKVKGEFGWSMRLSAPTMLDETPEGQEKRDFIWYAMRSWGWHAIQDTEEWQPLEDAWRATLS